jgi:hypothetical protein
MLAHVVDVMTLRDEVPNLARIASIQRFLETRHAGVRP